MGNRRRRRKEGPDRPAQGLPDELRQRLRYEREQGGLSLRALAERCDLSPSYLSLIESGGRLPDIEAAERLAEALRLEPHVRDAFLAAVRLARGYRKGSTHVEALQWARTWQQLQPLLDHSGLEIRPVDLDQIVLDQQHDAAAAGCPALFASANLDTDDLAHVPLLREGRTPDMGSAVTDSLRLDPAILPAGEDLHEAYAWRLNERSLVRIADLLSPGDVVILTPVTSATAPRVFERRDLWLVEHDDVLVLTRLQAASQGETLFLLPPPGSDLPVEWQPEGRDALRARVVAAIRSWRR